MHRLLSIVSFLAALTVSGQLRAIQGESVFLKAYLGAGYSYVTQSDEKAGTKLTLTGPLGLTMIQAGGSLSASTKIFAFTGFNYGPSLSVKAENIKIDTQYNYFFIHDFGLGMGFYSKSGLSLSLAGSISNNYYNYSVYQTSGVGTYTRHGWGAHAIIGQELTTTGRFTWGVSLITSYNHVYDVGPSADAPISSFYGGLAVSAMYD